MLDLFKKVPISGSSQGLFQRLSGSGHFGCQRVFLYKAIFTLKGKGNVSKTFENYHTTVCLNADRTIGAYLEPFQ